MKTHLFHCDHPPRVLEVGVDRGVTFISLVAFLARCKDSFTVVGIDVRVQEQVQIVLNNLDLTSTQCAYLLEDNSLKVLPQMAAGGPLWDLVLIDGDHNYHTVSEELKVLEGLVEEGGMVVIDDYEGRWSERDLFYAEREGYENNPKVTPKVNTTKHGVKTAVDEFLAREGSKWDVSQPVQGEPIMLVRKPTAIVSLPSIIIDDKD